MIGGEASISLATSLCKRVFFYCCILFQVFTTYTLTVFKCLNQVETMYQTPPLNVKVEPRSTFKGFTFTRDLSFSLSN